MKNTSATRLIFILMVLSLVLSILYSCATRPDDPPQPSQDTTGTGTTESTATSSQPESVETTQSTQPSTPTQPATDPTQPTEPATEPTVPSETQPTESQPTETQPAETQPPETEPTAPPPTLPTATHPVDPQPDDATGEKVIYLTFDDGPGKYTPQLLDILDKYNVKVTFFVIGASKLEYLDDIADAGHSIGIHTDTHKYETIYSGTDAFWDDFYAIEDKIFQHTGIHTKLHRFPGGSSNSTSKKYCKGIMSKLVKQMEEKGYTYFDWNVDSNDAGGSTTPGEVYQNVISGVDGKTYSVVLMHDVKQYTVEAVESIIRWGLENGYIFKALDESSPEVHHTVHN